VNAADRGVASVCRARVVVVTVGADLLAPCCLVTDSVSAFVVERCVALEWFVLTVTGKGVAAGDGTSIRRFASCAARLSVTSAHIAVVDERAL